MDAESLVLRFCWPSAANSTNRLIGFLRVRRKNSSASGDPNVANKKKPDSNKRLPQADTPAVTLREDLRPTELFERCKSNQHNWTTVNLQKVKLFLAEEYLLGTVNLPPAPKEMDKYEHLLNILREAANKDVRLVLLAKWLKEENICTPEDILAADTFKKVAKKYFAAISSTDFRHADTVRAWIPYFDCLLAELRVLHSTSKLVEKGYAESAVTAAWGKRSSVSAACEWLSDRIHVDAGRLANAYSYLYGRRFARYKNTRQN